MRDLTEKAAATQLLTALSKEQRLRFAVQYEADQLHAKVMWEYNASKQKEIHARLYRSAYLAEKERCSFSCGTACFPMTQAEVCD